MNFLEKGYQTGNVWLPGLDITVYLNSNQFFRNDGIVKDMQIHTNKVYYEINPRIKHDSYPIPLGRCIITYDERSNIAAAIFVKENDPINHIFNYGHESVEALIKYGRGDVLLDELKKEGFFIDPFQRYNDTENIANIGGFLALHKKNYRDCSMNCPELQELYSEFLDSYKKQK
jgi:hypothetical protein